MKNGATPMSRENVRSLEEVNEVGRLLSATPPAVARVTLVILLGLVAAGTIWAALSRADQVAKARGLVRSVGDLARVQVERAGTLSEVGKRPGQTVRSGEVLARLDDALLRVEHEKSTRALEAKRREVAEIETLRRIAEEEAASERRSSGADLEVARAALAQQKNLESRRHEATRASLALEREGHEVALQEAVRGRRLAAHGLMSGADLENLENRLRAAKVRLDSAERLAVPDASAVELASRRVAAADEATRLATERARARLQELQLRTATATAELARLEKDLERLDQELTRCVIRSPITGIMVEGEPQVGDVVQAGASLFRVAPGGELRFDALVHNSDIAGIEVGMSARVKLDAYPYQQFGVIEGRIAYIAKDATTPGEDGGAAGGFYEVRIELPSRPDGVGRALELGMAGQAEIIRGNERILVLAFRKLEDRVEI